MEFSDIALAKFLQALPDLSPYIVNFTDAGNELDQGESEIKVGIFTLQMGVGQCYVPVVGKGTTVFPIDSVFIEEENMFKPLSPTVISGLIGSASSNLGSVKKIPTSVDRNPSVQDLIQPPKTGKFVYASASRLPEFLAVVPAPVRKSLFEKIASEQSVYSALDKLFGLKAIFDVLKSKNQGDSHGQKNSVNASQSGAEASSSKPQASVLTTPEEVKNMGKEYITSQFLDNGYAINSDTSATHSRVAVTYMPWSKSGAYKDVSPAFDGGKDYAAVFADGDTRAAFVPQYHSMNPVKNDSLVSIFADGSYIRGQFVGIADPLPRKEVLDTLFSMSPPKLLRELSRGERFVVFTAAGEALGPFTADSVTRSNRGVEIDIYVYNMGIRKLCGFTNFTKDVDKVGDMLVVPHNVFVLTLGGDVTSELARTAIDARDMRELRASQLLGDEMVIRFDGVEYSTNDGPLGSYGESLKVLVNEQDIDPDVAKSFLKQAEETSFVRIFMSKKAADQGNARPTPIESYGEAPPPVDNVSLGGAFMSDLNGAMQTNDAQIIESTIIGQLLQVPDLFEYISEYLPEIEQTVDRLGRILLVTRIKIDQMSESLDSDSVFALISQLKTVYRQLGDTVVKLRGYSNSAMTAPIGPVGRNKTKA